MIVSCKEHNISALDRSKKSNERTVVQEAGKVAAIQLRRPGRWKRERHQLHVEAVL